MISKNESDISLRRNRIPQTSFYISYSEISKNAQKYFVERKKYCLIFCGCQLKKCLQFPEISYIIDVAVT